MRRLFVFLCVLSLLLTLCACGQNTEETPSLTEAPTQTPTEAPTEPVTEVPTEAPTEAPAMTGLDLYWKMSGAVYGKDIGQHTTTVKMDMRAGEAGVTVQSKIETESKITMNESPLAINEEIRVWMAMVGLEIEQYTRNFIRTEDEMVVCYSFADTLGECEKFDMSRSSLAVREKYTVRILPFAAPDDVVVDEELQQINGKDVYVLRYTDSYLNMVEQSGDKTIDAELAKIPVQHVTYVDTETFLPVRMEQSLATIDEEFCKTLYAMMQGVNIEDLTNITVEINELSIVTDGLIFGDVEVPDIPQEDLDRITGSEEPAGETNEL